MFRAKCCATQRVACLLRSAGRTLPERLGLMGNVGCAKNWNDRAVFGSSDRVVDSYVSRTTSFDHCHLLFTIIQSFDNIPRYLPTGSLIKPTIYVRKNDLQRNLLHSSWHFAKTVHGPHSFTLVVVLFGCYLCCSMYCLCVNVYCHRVTAQLQLINTVFFL
jgi:hypothetical protein